MTTDLDQRIRSELSRVMERSPIAPTVDDILGSKLRGRPSRRRSALALACVTVVAAGAALGAALLIGRGDGGESILVGPATPRTARYVTLDLPEWHLIFAELTPLPDTTSPQAAYELYWRRDDGAHASVWVAGTTEAEFALLQARLVEQSPSEHTVLGQPALLVVDSQAANDNTVAARAIWREPSGETVDFRASGITPDEIMPLLDSLSRQPLDTFPPPMAGGVPATSAPPGQFPITSGAPPPTTAVSYFPPSNPVASAADSPLNQERTRLIVDDDQFSVVGGTETAERAEYQWRLGESTGYITILDADPATFDQLVAERRAEAAGAVGSRRVLDADAVLIPNGETLAALWYQDGSVLEIGGAFTGDDQLASVLDRLVIVDHVTWLQRVRNVTIDYPAGGRHDTILATGDPDALGWVLYESTSDTHDTTCWFVTPWHDRPEWFCASPSSDPSSTTWLQAGGLARQGDSTVWAVILGPQVAAVEATYDTGSTETLAPIPARSTEHAFAIGTSPPDATSLTLQLFGGQDRLLDVLEIPDLASFGG